MERVEGVCCHELGWILAGGRVDKRVEKGRGFWRRVEERYLDWARSRREGQWEWIWREVSDFTHTTATTIATTSSLHSGSRVVRRTFQLDVSRMRRQRFGSEGSMAMNWMSESIVPFIVTAGKQKSLFRQGKS